MPFTQTHIPHRTTDRSQDTTLKIVTQNPESTASTVNGLTTPVGQVTDIVIGHEFTILARVGFGINSPAAPTVYRTPFFPEKTAPFKFRILQAGFEIVDLTAADFTDGDGGNLDLTIIRGDGAASEVESDVVADVALDDDWSNGKGGVFPTLAVPLVNNEVVAGGSLYADLNVDPDATAGATNDGAILDVWARCIRVN